MPSNCALHIVSSDEYIALSIWVSSFDIIWWDDGESITNIWIYFYTVSIYRMVVCQLSFFHSYLICFHLYFRYIWYMQFPILIWDIIRVKVNPGVKKDEYMSTMPDGTIKIRLKATPTDGKANIWLIAFLEKETGKKWEIKSGFTSERKILIRKI